jgi:uncharacterized protein YbjT (DUF2867 family)
VEPKARPGAESRVFLLEQGIPVRALVHKLDSRCDELRTQGAEVVEGDLLNPASAQAAMRNVKRGYFTYPVAAAQSAKTLFKEYQNDKICDARPQFTQ